MITPAIRLLSGLAFAALLGATPLAAQTKPQITDSGFE